MNRRAAILALALAGCSATPIPPPVQLAAPSALALAGKFMFVASTGGSELRVITGTESNPVFLRAPDPLYALAIPTAPMPVALATSNVDGNVSPFVFALSTVSRKVSVAETGLLTRLGDDVPVNDMIPLAIAVPVWVGTGPVRVAVAGVTSGAEGTGQLKIASFDPALAGNPTGINDVAFGAPVDLGAWVPQAMAASPSALNGDLLAIGARDPAGTGGALLAVNVSATPPTVTTVPVPGPVVAVAYAPDGKTVFGASEVSCTTTSGPSLCALVFSYVLQSGALKLEPTEGPALPAPRGIAVGGSVTLRDPSGNALPDTVSTLVLVSAIDGKIYAVEGANVTPVSYSITPTTDGGPTSAEFAVWASTLSAPGALLYVPSTELGKPVFYVVFQGGNALARIEPDLLAATTSNGFTIRQ